MLVIRFLCRRGLKAQMHSRLKTDLEFQLSLHVFSLSSNNFYINLFLAAFSSILKTVLSLVCYNGLQSNQGFFSANSVRRQS